jgi:hypothetical protein
MSLTRAPYKQKRKSKKNASLHKDDADAVDTIMYVEVELNTNHGPKTKHIKVPLAAVMEEHGDSNSAIIDNPDLAPEWVMQEPQVADEPIQHHVGMVRF